NWGDEDGCGIFVGGQQHHYDTPLGLIPPESAGLVTLEHNLVAGNENKGASSGAARIIMRSRVHLGGNLFFDDPGGLRIQTSGALAENNTIVDKLEIANDSKASSELPGPVILHRNIAGGRIEIAMPVPVHRVCGQGAPSGDDKLDIAPQFLDDDTVFK